MFSYLEQVQVVCSVLIFLLQIWSFLMDHLEDIFYLINQEIAYLLVTLFRCQEKNVKSKNYESGRESHLY